MAEELQIPTSENREEIYRSLIPQLETLIGDEKDDVAIMSNIAAALRQTFGFFWIGFYVVKNDELVLGPFQGDVACFRIQKGKGVCGTAWEKGETIIVADVDVFPGHIACSSASRSEIVVPIFRNGKVAAILDVDSNRLNDFSAADQVGLQQIAELCSNYLNTQ
ncbi:MAG: L-methionine (R)-S-oxide reductase [Bacteroidia bacterium]|jgi:L-methionine (R)-S-oxide reductase